MEEKINSYKALFWDAFHRPRLHTERYKNLWENLEKINDHLAGPLFSIYENGHCDYFYNDKTRFPFMNSSDDFLKWTTHLAEQYYHAIEAEKPLDETEEMDFNVLMFQSDTRMDLIRIAYDIVDERLKSLK